MTITAAISEHPIPAHMIAKAARMVTDGEVRQVKDCQAHGSIEATPGAGVCFGAPTPCYLETAYRVREYVVRITYGEWTCSCPSQIRCSHMLAALHVHTEA